LEIEVRTMSALPPRADIVIASRLRPLCAMCGRLRVGKDFVHVGRSGRSSHVFGLLVRLAWPLAIMPSADQVPVKTSHSEMLWH
jgi:hypothetical protein